MPWEGIGPGQKVRTKIDDRVLTLTNLDKVLYPDVGFTKAQMLDYYTRIAPVLLPHVKGRPVSFKRYPNGVHEEGFFAKNAPRGTPKWVRTIELPAPGSTHEGRETVNYVVIDDLPTLIWAANLAAIELHVPQWRVGPRGGVRKPDLLVFDLDPGAPATIVECCRVACLLRELLREDGLQAWAKTSGKKGLQLYVPINETSDERTSGYAKELARRLARAHPDLVVYHMRKTLRPGKVLVDWSQNNAAKTTVAPYSLRATNAPTVSTPVTWDEVESCRSPADLRFESADVLGRVDEFGDLMEPLLTTRQRFPRVASSAA
ncbi:ATP-dependent DNA ligase [Carbonactinospora thermoautotrophica]|uniref:non-homologous end-joining DNA ligase n=1 Tax=Carbonactinospora thermoautotrophica TaxID=1469144 RepID=UPI0035591BE9|nr:ATP-dependent DNA ligase [Carbonactinospora thermoautotrophica]